MEPLCLCVMLLAFLVLVRGALVFNILDYGAVGDNATINTIAIQRAATRAARARWRAPCGR